MTPDLKMLTWSAVLTFVVTLPYVLGLMMKVGLPALAGNRENFPAVEGWIGRSMRLHKNMIEAMIVFTALVVVAHLAQKANATTALGATIFFWARVVHAGLYIAGIPWLRTGAWAVSVVGMLMILSQLL
jgi:uncharacterized MAPEG superfamily protein